MPKPKPEGFREDVVGIARNRGLMSAAEFGIDSHDELETESPGSASS